MKYILFAVLATSVISSGYAKNLIDYRQELYPILKTEIEEELEKEIDTIKGSLLISDDIGVLINSDVMSYDQTVGFKRKPQRSAFFKYKMQKAIANVLQDKRYGVPLPFNSQWSIERFKHEKMKDISKKVMSILNQGEIAGINENAQSRIGQFLVAIREKLVKRKKVKSYKKINKPDKVLAMKNSVIDYIRNYGPTHSDGKSIEELIGTISEVNITEGVLHKVEFKDGMTKVPGQLSLMLTLRSDEDEQYLKIQELFIQYLEEQKRVFSDRLSFMNEINFFGFVMNFAKTYILQTFDKMTGEDSQANRDKFQKNIHFVERGINAKKAHYFMEGVEVKGHKAQNQYLSGRIVLINRVLPLLKKILIESKEISKQLKKLSQKQVDFLLNLFLSSRRMDVMTQREMVEIDPVALDSINLSQLLEAQKEEVNSLEGKIEISNDFYYYQLMGKQFVRLQEALESERNSKTEIELRLNNLNN